MTIVCSETCTDADLVVKSKNDLKKIFGNTAGNETEKSGYEYDL